MSSLNEIQPIPSTVGGDIGYEKKYFVNASIKDWEDVLFYSKNKKFSNRVNVHEHSKSKSPIFCGTALDIFLKFSEYSLHDFLPKQQKQFWKLYNLNHKAILSQSMFMKLEQTTWKSQKCVRKFCIS